MATTTSIKPITVTMGLPPKELWQNRPCHWSKHSKVAKNYRYAAGCLALVAAGGRPDRPPDYALAKLVFWWGDRRRRDIRNAEAAMKPAYDGIVDAGLIFDDDFKHLGHEQTVFEYDKTHPRVEIIIRQPSPMPVTAPHPYRVLP